MRLTYFGAVLALIAALTTSVTGNIAFAVGAFDKRETPVPQIHTTENVIEYPDGTSVKIVCVIQGSRREEDGTIVPLPIETGVPKVGDLYINTCRGVKV
jgi:hypothetical protein